MPDTIKISELDEALAIADAAEFPYTQENGGELTTFKAPLTQIAAKIVEDMSYAGIDLPAGAGVKSVENTLNYLINAVGGDPNGNISDSYDPTTAYVKGDLCIYENVLYICTAPTTGTFDPSNWTATTIDNVIGSLSTLTTTVKSSLVGAVNEVNGASLKASELRVIRETATTNNNGTIDSNALTGGAIPLSRTILSAYSPNGYFVKIGYYSSRYTFDVYDSSFQLVRNTAVEICIVSTADLAK